MFTAAVAVALALAVAVMSGRGAPVADEPTPLDTKAIDAVFAKYVTPGSPGCMLGVIRDGRFVYTRGYGRANVEHDVPMSAATVFDIGSTSKQFAAMATLLLAADGRLSLDDDIRRHLPELPDYGTPITIRHLLTHTSGLRDYITLMLLAGWQIEDVTTPRQALDLIRRQRRLDFPPGTEYAYSNTGYFLISQIVERVSGQSLAAFARTRIFEPAGMTSTRYMDDHRLLVPRRATGYAPAGEAFSVAMSNWEQLGDGAVQTSLDDLLKWDANFYAPRIGGERAIGAMQEQGRLVSGKAIPYGLGLSLGTYRGLRTVRHGGSWAGYRSDLLRFPDERTSIAVLCNLETAEPEEHANRVADVVLAPRFTEARPPQAGGSADAGADPPAKEFAGVYFNRDRLVVMRFGLHQQRLALVSSGPPRPLLVMEDGWYRIGASPARYRFTSDAGARRLERRAEDGGIAVLEGHEEWKPSAAELDRYAGAYESEELNTRWRVERRDDTLIVDDLRQPPRVLRPALQGVFTGGPLVVQFDDAASNASGFVVGAGRARGIRFERVSGAAP